MYVCLNEYVCMYVCDVCMNIYMYNSVDMGGNTGKKKQICTYVCEYGKLSVFVTVTVQGNKE